MHHFAIEHLVVDDFAVQLDFAVVQHFYADFLAGIDFRIVLFHVLAGEEARQFDGDAALFHLVDDDDGEQSVVHLRVGTNRHSAAYAGAVAHAYHKHALVHRFAVYRYAELVPFDVRERVEEGSVIFHFAVESLHIRVADEHVDVHTRARDVQASAAADVYVIDISSVAFQDEFHRVLDFAGMTRRADEVVARAAGDYAEGDVVEIRYAVEHLVERAVAAHNDEFRVGFCGKLAREFGGVARIFGVVHGVFGAVLAKYLFDLFQRFQAFALAALGVDDDVEHKQTSSIVRFFNILVHSHGSVKCAKRHPRGVQSAVGAVRKLPRAFNVGGVCKYAVDFAAR